MKLSGRVAAAMEIIDGMETLRRPVSVALKDWAGSHRFAGSKDRAAIGNLVYDAERRRASHAFTMGAKTGRALVLATLVFDWQMNVEDITTAFATDKFAPEPLTDDEITRLYAEDPLAGAADHVRANIPEWLVEQFKTAFGDDWIEEANQFSTRPPLDMRINTLSTASDRSVKSLKRFAPEPMAIAANGLRIDSGPGDVRTPNVQIDEAYQKGWIEIQDEGSQIVSALSGASDGDSVLDLCAGAGGKTLALAAQMSNRGQIFSYDIDYGRLAPIYERVKRAQVHNVQIRKPEEGSLDNLQDAMSHVFVDAPCTGTGTWRRHPDSKWRLTKDQMQKRAQEQRGVLNNAVKFVKRSGRLIYVTCSILPAENDEQIAWFLSAHEGFKVQDPAENWEKTYPDIEAPRFTKYGTVLTPHSTKTDGFYISILTDATV